MVHRSSQGNGGASPLSRERLSDLIGQIYDCTFNPGLWPEVIHAVGDVTNCFAGMIVVADLQGSQLRLAQQWNYAPAWLARQQDHEAEVTELWKKFLASHPHLDEPASTRRDLPETYDTRYYAEWGRPQGIIDTLHLVVLRQPHRLGEFGLSRHESQGLVTDEDIARLRLLAPHIRRAVTISDLLDMQSFERQAFGATLDSLAISVVIVADAGRILHANDAARHMLDAGSPVLQAGGCLAARDPRATQELLRAIALAQADEATIGAAGIGVPLVQADMTAAVAHVLPLARGDIRMRIAPQAIAAVFIVPGGSASPADLSTVARIFGLTPAETRQLEYLLAGATLNEAAAALGVSAATARTHREHLFAKTSVSRRADLVALVERLVPPVRR